MIPRVQELRAQLGDLLAAGTLSIGVDAPIPLEHAARALARLQQGTGGRAVVRQTAGRQSGAGGHEPEPFGKNKA